MYLRLEVCKCVKIGYTLACLTIEGFQPPRSPMDVVCKRSAHPPGTDPVSAILVEGVSAGRAGKCNSVCRYIRTYSYSNYYICGTRCGFALSAARLAQKGWTAPKAIAGRTGDTKSRWMGGGTGGQKPPQVPIEHVCMSLGCRREGGDIVQVVD